MDIGLPFFLLSFSTISLVIDEVTILTKLTHLDLHNGTLPVHPAPLRSSFAPPYTHFLAPTFELAFLSLTHITLSHVHKTSSTRCLPTTCGEYT